MFTGIIEEIGRVKLIARGAKASRITIHASKVTEDLKIGDSVNTNGVCLTVVEKLPSGFVVDVMPETMMRTSFSLLREGTGVNLERAVRLCDRLGGHLVSGHIDGTGRVIRQWKDENAVWFRISSLPQILRYMIEKGSVAVDGISLTVVQVESDSFTVSVIPHTQEVTTLMAKKTGDIVNIECDIVAKYLEKLGTKRERPGGIDPGFLAEKGFTE